MMIIAIIKYKKMNLFAIFVAIGFTIWSTSHRKDHCNHEKNQKVHGNKKTDHKDFLFHDSYAATLFNSYSCFRADR